uniref:Ig-like domain-containing protein n=1 Tax=Fundulus heteroclitus TaxID=8078 RepID=A0A3Q2QDN2_FUNHE
PITALPVTFKRELQSLIATEGDCAVFCCELSKPEAPVEWRKGRVVLKPGEKYEMKQEGRLTKLTINRVEESDAGKYTCKTKHSQSTAELRVRGETRISTASEKMHQNTFLLMATKITRDAQLMKDGEKYQMKQEGRVAEMLIRNVTLADAGEYSCSAGTAVTSADIKQRSFPRVAAPPVTFKTKLRNQQVEEENSVTLSCEVSKPSLAVEWRKGKELLKSDFKYQIKNRNSVMELTVKNAQPEDSGLYSCICEDVKTTAHVLLATTQKSKQSKPKTLYELNSSLIQYMLGFLCSCS